jgi:hypothetical protein
MSRLSITARLVLLSAALLVILIATNFYLNRGLKDGADALVEEARYVETLRAASAAEKSFGDLKYWLTDLAVSWRRWSRSCGIRRRAPACRRSCDRRRRSECRGRSSSRPPCLRWR